MLLRWAVFIFLFVSGSCIECPVCTRVVTAAIDYALSNNIRKGDSLEKYCALASIGVQEQQFCYNIGNIKQEINRLLEYGAQESRVCKRVHSINPHFCSSSLASKSSEITKHLASRLQRGIIYE